MREAGVNGAVELGVVESVQWLAEFKHHVVGDVDEGGDGTDAAAFQAALHPFRCRGLGVDAGDDAAAVERAGFRRIENYSASFLDTDWRRGDFGQVGRGACQGGYFAGDAGKRQAVGAVGGELEGAQAVVKIEVTADAFTDWSVVRQDEQARGILGNRELLGRAQHARGFDAAHLGDLDRELAGQHGAG